MTLAIGLDVGTSGIRTAVVDQTGVPVSAARVAHARQDPDRIDAELWWQSVVACLRLQVDALNDHGHDPADIVGMAVDGTSGTMVLTDANITPVTHALMYNSSGFEPEACRIERIAPEQHITRGQSSALARALRLCHADAGGKAFHLLHQADFIAGKLTGIGGESDVNNSLKTGVDPVTCQWPDWFADVGFDMALLPRVRAAGTAIAPIRPSLANQLGLPASIMVHAGTTDSIAAFLACANPAPGLAVTSLGTTLAVKVLTRTRVDAPALGLYSHRLGDVWLAGGASNTGGGVLENCFPAEDIARLSAQIDPSRPTGLDYYPLLVPGERFPVNDPNLEPRLIPRPPSDVRFLQGMLEGIAAIEARAYDVIRQCGGDSPQIIYTAGGGAKNAVWTRIRSRILGIQPVTAPHTEAAIGSARLALGSFRTPATRPGKHQE